MMTALTMSDFLVLTLMKRAILDVRSTIDTKLALDGTPKTVSNSQSPSRTRSSTIEGLSSMLGAVLNLPRVS